jgi:glycine cleavage system H protein
MEPAVNPTEPGASDPLLHLVEHAVWARLHGDGTATVGITESGIQLSGEIYMCRAKPAGTQIERGRSIAVVELAKAIVSVKSAVSGEVVEVNGLLDSAPELVHRDPYGQGWIARLKLRNLAGDLPFLVPLRL